MGRPSKSLISRDSAARAALSIIDTQGLQSLSLELVARRLGVKAPSLYYHFKDKNELLSEVALILLKDIDPTKIDENYWEKTLIRLCKSARRSILRHPNAAPLLLQFFPRRILLGAYDFWVSMCPYPPDTHMAIIEGTEKLTYASALFAAAARSYGVAPMPDYELDQYPHLTTAIRANPHDDEEMFEEAVTAFLRGFRHFPKAPRKLTDGQRKRARRLGLTRSFTTV